MCISISQYVYIRIVCNVHVTHQSSHHHHHSAFSFLHIFTLPMRTNDGNFGVWLCLCMRSMVVCENAHACVHACIEDATFTYALQSCRINITSFIYSDCVCFIGKAPRNRIDVTNFYCTKMLSGFCLACVCVRVYAFGIYVCLCVPRVHSLHNLNECCICVMHTAHICADVWVRVRRIFPHHGFSWDLSENYPESCDTFLQLQQWKPFKLIPRSKIALPVW